jgi:exonuclease III
MRFGTWNVTSPYSRVSLSTVVMELGRCKLDLVGVQEVRRDKGGVVHMCKSRKLYFFLDKETKIINWEKDFVYITE